MVEDAATASVEKGLCQFPEFGLQGLEPVSGEVKHLPVEHARLGIFGGQPCLELVVALRQSAFGAALAGLGLCDQIGPPRLELGFGFTASLLQTGLDQDVVENARDADAKRLFHVAGVEDDLEVGPEPLQVVRIHLRGGFVLEQEMLVADPDDAVNLSGQHEASG